MQYKEHGLYIIKDSYFDRFPSASWVSNKCEHRPYYFAIKDLTGLMWMIPLTTKVDNIKRKIEREENKRGKGNCIFYHVGIIAGIERGFKIGDIFPVSEEYILRPYVLQEREYVVTTKNMITEIESKATKFLNMVERNIIKPSCEILSIKAELLKEVCSNDY